VSAQRRRVIAVVAALTILTTVGVVWLIRLAAGGPQAQIVTPAADAPSAAGSPGTAAPATLEGSAGPDGSTTPTAAGPGTGPAAATTSHRAAPAPSGKPAGTSSTGPATGGGQAQTPPIPERAIRVGGATLDNDNPRTMCAVFTSTRLGLPVTVTGVAVSGGVLQIDPGTCAEDDNIAGFPECVDGMTLKPGHGCFAGALTHTTEAQEYRGVITLALRARCTSTAVTACDVPELRASPPSAARPVDITWSDAGRRVCYAVRAAGEAANPFCNPDGPPAAAP
jgi:hypothetical protein